MQGILTEIREASYGGVAWTLSERILEAFNVGEVKASSRKEMPFGQRSRPVQFEGVAAIDAAFLVEAILDRGVYSSELLESFDVLEFHHSPFSSSK